MAETKSTMESAREWIVQHKLRTVGKDPCRPCYIITRLLSISSVPSFPACFWFVIFFFRFWSMSGEKGLSGLAVLLGQSLTTGLSPPWRPASRSFMPGNPRLVSLSNQSMLSLCCVRSCVVGFCLWDDHKLTGFHRFGKNMCGIWWENFSFTSHKRNLQLCWADTKQSYGIDISCIYFGFPSCKNSYCYIMLYFVLNQGWC